MFIQNPVSMLAHNVRCVYRIRIAKQQTKVTSSRMQLLLSLGSLFEFCLFCSFSPSDPLHLNTLNLICCVSLSTTTIHSTNSPQIAKMFIPIKSMGCCWDFTIHKILVHFHSQSLASTIWLRKNDMLWPDVVLWERLNGCVCHCATWGQRYTENIIDINVPM